MKTILKILGGLILLILILLITLPILFKGKITELIQEQMDENLKARIELQDIDLSLISSFPDFSLELKGLKVTGTQDFEGIKLAEIGSIQTTLDLMSVISGDQIKIKTFGISDASFEVIVNKDTVANYDIVKSTEETTEEEVTEEETSEEPAAFAMSLESYFFRNINLIYDDKPGGIFTEVKNFTHEGSGDFTQDVFLLATQTNIDAVTLKMDGVRYLKKASFDIKFDTEIDMPNSKYTFKENHFGINNLMLHFDGYVALPDEETTEMDLTFSTEKTTFKSVLSLVPAVYMKDFESVQTNGNFALGGFAKGSMKGDDLPAFNLDLKVDKGMFQYPDLPKSVDNINIDLNVKNPGGSDDNTVVDLRKFHLELGGNPVDMKLLVKTPVSDANIDGQLMASIDLSTLSDVLPTEAGEEYQGKIDADIKVKGQVSTLEKEDYENFDASGSMIVEGVVYQDSSLDYPVTINRADFQFSPKEITMAEFNCLLGKSDIQAQGSIGNFLPYYFNDKTINGVMSVSSTLLDLNELAGVEEEPGEEEDGEESEGDASQADSSVAPAEGEVAEVPGNIDFVMTSNFKKVIYDNMEMTDMNGKITIRDQKVSMDNLDMKMLGGGLVMNGYYETTNPDVPTIDFNMQIDRFDVPQTYETFNTVEQMAPIAENATGAFSTSMKLTCDLDNNMEPLTETMTGGGDLQTHNVMITESDALNKIADALKNPDLKTLKLENVNISYEFRDGRVYVEPFDMKLGDINANVSGSNGFDMTLDYLVKTEIPSDKMGAASGATSSLLDQFNQATGAGVSMPKTVKVDLVITGTSDDPKIKPSFGGVGQGGSKSTKDQAKDKAKEELDKLKKEAEQKAREEADRLKKEAEQKAREEADKAKKEAEERARQEAEKAKKEAERKAKEEAEKAKKKAEENAKKELKKLFGK